MLKHVETYFPGSPCLQISHGTIRSSGIVLILIASNLHPQDDNEQH
jgi:hypothetical protein